MVFVIIVGLERGIDEFPVPVWIGDEVVALPRPVSVGSGVAEIVPFVTDMGPPALWIGRPDVGIGRVPFPRVLGPLPPSLGAGDPGIVPLGEDVGLTTV